MDDLKRRFGRLVTAHRKRMGWTQEELADHAGVSIDTISKLETGVVGARFPMIERIASALQVDPAELFSTEIPSGAIRRKALNEICAQLAGKPDEELVWINSIIDVVLKQRPK